MTPEEITIKLTNHNNEISSLKHRMNEVEEQNKTINNLALSVKGLAINIENMVREQQNISARMAELEKKPAKRWEAIVTALIGTVVGAAISMFIGG